MDDVADDVRTFLNDILSSGHQGMKLAMVQRSKFEGWLKFELAARLSSERHYEGIRLEPLYAKGEHADLSFKHEGTKWFVELKTINTSWRHDEIENRTRPVTRNVDGVISDIKKIDRIGPSYRALVAFVIFPIPRRIWADERHKLNYHLQRIEAGASLESDSLQADGDFVEMSGEVGFGLYVIDVRR